MSTELRTYFGIKSVHFTFDNKDYMVMVKKISDEQIVFVISSIDINLSDHGKIFFPSIAGDVTEEIEITDIYDEPNNNIGIVASFLSNTNDFFIILKRYFDNLILETKRKEERILCNKKNIERLKMQDFFIFQFRKKNYKAIIKDISYSGIRFLTNPEILQADNDTFTFFLKFFNPDHKFLFTNCKIIRKEEFIYLNTRFCELVLSLSENLIYKDRLNNYFNANYRGR